MTQSINKVDVMTPCVLWIPVYQYTSIPVYQPLPSPTLPWYWWQRLWISTPLAAVGMSPSSPHSGGIIPSYTVGNSLESSSRHVDHFCPIRPGVTPGLQDHSYTSVWCNTRPLGPLATRVWCNTRPPGPPLPPSGGLVNQLYPVGNSLELCRKTPGIPLDHSPGLLPGLEDHIPESSLESRLLPSPCLVKLGL